MVPEKYLQKTGYAGEGFRPLVDYGRWRVAVLRFIDDLLPEHISSMERHEETDEVFILLEGRCILFFGEGEEGDGELFAEDMLPLTLYNVRKGAFHTHTLTRDATVLIVENRDTGPQNSTTLALTPAQKTWLRRQTEALWG